MADRPRAAAQGVQGGAAAPGAERRESAANPWQVGRSEGADHPEQAPGGTHQGQPGGPSTEPDGGAARIADLTEEVAALEDRWRRTAADLDNLRKRMGADVERERAAAARRAASALLPIVDNLDLALEHATADPASLIQGILAVRDQAVAALARLGFPRRDDLGSTFDPARHEAVAAAPDADARPGTVVRVVRPAYGEAEDQLRPAAVVVATGPPEAEGREAAGAEPE